MGGGEGQIFFGGAESSKCSSGFSIVRSSGGGGGSIASSSIEQQQQQQAAEVTQVMTDTQGVGGRFCFERRGKGFISRGIRGDRWRRNPSFSPPRPPKKNTP